MNQLETMKWIFAQEEKKFVYDANTFFTRHEATKIIDAVCPISEITNIGGGGSTGLFSALSNGSEVISSLALKRALIIDIHMASAQLVFKDQYQNRVSEICAGLHPIGPAQEIKAQAGISPCGDKVIWFSDSLFSFLWDYHLGMFAKLSNPTKKSEAAGFEKLMVKKLSKRLYDSLEFERILNTENLPQNAKHAAFLSSLFIFFHELGHHIFSHEVSEGIEAVTPVAGRTNKISESVLFEYQADLFAFDCYVNFVTRFMTLNEANAEIILMTGPKYIELLAKSEGEIDSVDWKNISHPPSAFRMMHIILRHEELFRKYTRFGPMIDEWKKIDDLHLTVNFEFAQEYPFQHMFA